MRNFDQKVKDMAESVLPSTARVMARRTRSAIHRRDRHRVRQQLHVLADAGDTASFDSVLGHDFRRDLGDMVEDRRGADKVGSLVRWAERRVLTDPMLATADLEDRVSHFRRLLPDNTIGRHALDHITSMLIYLDDGPQVRLARRRRSGGPSNSELALREAAKTVLVGGLHGVLNRRLKNEAWTYTTKTTWIGRERYDERVGHPPRLLAGLHDIEAFAKAADREVGVITHEVAGLVR